MRLLRAHSIALTAALIGGLILGTALYFVLVRTVPRYSATQRFECSPASASANEVTGTLGAGVGGRDEMEKFMQTQALILESDDILRRVIDDRQVRDTAWAQQSKFKTASGQFDAEEALRALKKIVDARVLTETKYVQVSLSVFNRDSAKVLIETLSSVYLDDANRRARAETQGIIDLFTGRVKDLTKNIQAFEQKMESLLAEKGLTGLTVQESSYFNQVTTLQPVIVNLSENIAQSEEQLKTYEKMQDAAGGAIIPESIRTEVERSPIIQGQDSNIATLEASIRASKQLMGEDHREVKALQKRLDALREQRDSTLQRRSAEFFKTVIENLRNSVESQKASKKELEDKLADAKIKLNEVTLTLKQHEAFKNERDALATQRAELQGQLDALQILVQKEGRVRAAGLPIVPQVLAFPLKIQIIPLVTLAVLGLTGGVIVLRELREQRIRGPQDVAITRTAVLGMVPDLALDLSNPERAETACIDRPSGAIAESIRQIRSRVMAYAGGAHKVILVASGLPESGASAVISNLAANAAATDLRVLVIDANVRRPSQHKVFGVPEDAKGLGDVLLGGASFDEAVRPTNVENVSLMAAGRKDHRVHERFMMPVMARLIADAKAKYDLVLIDAAPAVVGNDAMTLARHCDATALVVRALKETRGLLTRLRNQLMEAKGEFLGVIVNGVKPSAGGYFKRNFEATHRYTFGEPVEPEPKKKEKKSKKKDQEPEPTAAV